MDTPNPWGRPGGDPSPDASPTSLEPFTFTGTTREYFGIWIVNILLTIVTIGIYSAWAKVRRLRYFYGNTRLAGSSFDFHASPIQILIGRIIVLVVLMVYNAALTFFPPAGIVLGVLFLFALPFFVMRGLRFNARVTSYRNVRFDFSGGYWGAFNAYVLGGLVAWLSLGILAPLASRWMWRYTLGNLHYGGRPVSTDPRLGALYRQWLLPAVLMLGGLVVFGASGIVISAYSTVLQDMLSDTADAGKMVAAVLAVIYTALIPVIILGALATLAYRAGTRNVAMNSTVIDGRHRLASSIHRGRFVWISVTNILATLLSLGLARPWAAIRMARFLAAATALQVSGSLDDYLDTVKESGAAVGAEYMDVEGFDFGF
ncbi:MAG: DUF898 family protein [Mesorhizobium sp.]|nr:DUF898 family protein [Mesorhizobium sp.]